MVDELTVSLLTFPNVSVPVFLVVSVASTIVSFCVVVVSSTEPEPESLIVPDLSKSVVPVLAVASVPVLDVEAEPVWSCAPDA